MDKISIVICDDMVEIIDHMTKIIDREDDMRVVGTATSGTDVLGIVRDTMPDILLLDIQMEDAETGIEVTGVVKQKYPDVKVIILTIHENDALLFKAFSVGANDYLVKDTTPKKIVSSIRNIYRNVYAIRPEIAEKLIREFASLQEKQRSLLYTINLITKLTNVEYEILKLLCEGYTRRAIARSRMVELVTVNTQIGKILKKLEYNNSKELVRDLKKLNIFKNKP
jgi:DNA-binding NarL/FixJ family response regulator